MSGAKRHAKERLFSIELDSGNSLKKVNVPNGAQRVLVEGTIGLLEQVELVEDAVLELVGTGGVLRVDLSRENFAGPARKARLVSRPMPASGSCGASWKA